MLNATVLNPVFWLIGVAAFFLAFRYFMRSVPQ
jgi:hypothetical protein